MYITDREQSLRLEARFEGTMRSLGCGCPCGSTAWGCRGPEPAPAGSGPARWLAVGDSFTLSPQVTEAETFAGQLSAGGQNEVFSTGVDDYSTWQATRRYQRLDEPLGVDGVLLTFFLGNDYEDNRRFRSELDGLASGRGPAHPAPAGRLAHRAAPQALLPVRAVVGASAGRGHGKPPEPGAGALAVA